MKITRWLPAGLLLGNLAFLVTDRAALAQPAPPDDTKSVIPKSLGPTVDTFLDVGDRWSKAKDAVDLGTTLATYLGHYLGILSPDDPNAPFKQLETQIQQTAVAINWSSTMNFIDAQRGGAVWAMDRLARAGPVAEGGNEDQSSGTALDAVGSGAAFLRPFSKTATDGLIPWKDLIPVSQQPTVTSEGLVYDWRLGVPALMELIGYRLAIIAGMDPNFRWNNRYDMELGRDRDVLLAHYNKMLAGVQCVYAPTGPNRTLGPGWVCVDVYTGQEGWYLWPWNNPDPEIIHERILGQLKQSMPFYQMRAMIDTLTFYINGGQDLSEVNGDIRPTSDGNLCLAAAGDIASGQIPLQLGTCDWSNNQWWTYDRAAQTITNPANGWCLDVENGDSLTGTPVWTYWCNGGNAQRWTWDPSTGILQNALGNVLDIHAPGSGFWGFFNPHGGSIAAQDQVWTWPLNGTAFQQWAALQACPSVCTAQAGPGNTSCGGTCGLEVCAGDPFCCDTQWDSVCVQEVTSFCGLKCF